MDKIGKERSLKRAYDRYLDDFGITRKSPRTPKNTLIRWAFWYAALMKYEITSVMMASVAGTKHETILRGKSQHETNIDPLLRKDTCNFYKENIEFAEALILEEFSKDANFVSKKKRELVDRLIELESEITLKNNKIKHLEHRLNEQSSLLLSFVGNINNLNLK